MLYEIIELKITRITKGKKEMYQDEVVRNMILPAVSWYKGIHEIRTEETHYRMGEVFLMEEF